MTGTFDFCPDYMVPETDPPEAKTGMSMNGWNFAAKPSVPYQKSFTVTLQGMRWYLQSSGLYDDTTDPEYNARRLEKFYEDHGTWDSFTFPHPHFGNLECRFKEAVKVPKAIPNSDGLIDAFEIKLVHHNPGY